MGLLLVFAGSLFSAAATAWLMVVAAMMGWIYFFGILLVPCFQYYMLFVDPRRCGPPIFVQLFGGMLAWSGMFMMSMEQPVRSVEAKPMRAYPNDADPVLPGSYVPPETDGGMELSVLQKLLYDVDPMLFAAVGGALVFLLVGTVVGTILLWNVGQDDEEAGSVA